MKAISSLASTLERLGRPRRTGRAAAGSSRGGDATYRGPPVAISDGKGGALVVYQRRSGEPDRLIHVYIQRVYGDVPTSARIAFLGADTGPGSVRLQWSVSSERSIRAGVYRRQDGEQWMRVGEPTLVGQSVLEFEDHDLNAGRYGYRLGVHEEGVESFATEVWVDIPSAFALTLFGFRPNPATSAPSIAFTLPDSRTAQVTVFDVKGRIVSSHDVGGFGPGVHVLPMNGQGRWDAGVYWVRLTHSDRTLTRKGVVAH